MSDNAQRLIERESRTARRLRRLFRIERAGAFERRPIEIARQMIDRRGRLIDDLIRLDAERRLMLGEPTQELDTVMGTLAREVYEAQMRCTARIEAIGDELLQRRSPGAVTGLRDSTSGRLLGHG
jgi:hypothetical protein